MRRAGALWPVFILLFALTFAPVDGAGKTDTPELPKAKVQKALDKVAAKTGPRVLILPIREGIELSTAVYVEREMKRAADEDFDMVLVELHTPGGRVDAMWRINQALSDALTADGIPVVSYVDRQAFSAGAIIAMSCDRIYVKRGGELGAAAPVFAGPQGPVEIDESYEEKILSALKGDARAVAKKKGHAGALAEAMIDRSLTVVEYTIEGKKEILTGKEYANRRKELIAKLGLAKEHETLVDQSIKEGRTICEEGKLLTLDFEQAASLGLAAGVVDSRAEVFGALKLKDPVVTEAAHNWSELVFGFFTSGGVRPFLLMLGLLGLYVEFKIPGFGLPGICGLSCLGMFFFGQYFMGVANYAGVILFVAGVMLLLIEFFVIPGFGVTGITGIVCMFAGMMVSMQEFIIPDFSNPWDMKVFKDNILVMAVAIMGSAVLMAILAKFLPKSSFFGRIILTSEGPAGELKASATIAPECSVEVGASGKTISACRPAGRAQFGEKLLDVVTEGQFIEPGSEVEVLEIEGNRIVVKKRG